MKQWLDSKLSTLNSLMHTIRLRGPWELEPVWRYVLAADGTFRLERENLPPAAKMKMPADWSEVYGCDFFARVRYRRVFHRPTGLGKETRVFLVVEPARSTACIMLKQALVGFVYTGEETKRFEITDRLEDDNVLEIFVDHPVVELIDGPPSTFAMPSTVDDSVLSQPGGLIGEVRLEIEI